MLDVLIIGAGLSGIGAARHLQRRCPGKSFEIVEARDRIGGTWDLFRYPGVRSDSDMYTLGYGFKPWRGDRAIAEGAEILAYLNETVDEAGLRDRIRFGHAVKSASWSGADACWTVRAERGNDGDVVEWRARFLFVCSGYYRYDAAHRPDFPGEADFAGRIVVPQFWPQQLDVAGRRVVIIGSGATAVTLGPALARAGAQVTLLQRSPSYVVALPSRDRLAPLLQRMLPPRAANAVLRWKNLAFTGFVYRLARRRPNSVRKRLIAMAEQLCGPDGAAAIHFAPRYAPWDQRVCVAPDGDLFRGIREGRISVVTEAIDRFVADGVRLASGRELAADIVVVATGIELRALGDIELHLDGSRFNVSQALLYKGAMLGDVPNLALTFGYVNASWTLKADLTAGFVCRLLQAMDRRNAVAVVARRQPDVGTEPLMPLSSGYVQRGAALLPRQGSRAPWRVAQSYVRDLLAIRFGRLDDGVLKFVAAAQKA
ncbi:MAG: NAD(P)/FAD-dependent oxidoreductase [Pseudomonadota bacterium]|nr:NAD(P)/FAD-dependent oxidoreductase [Pseudomonadota bacterium]